MGGVTAMCQSQATFLDCQVCEQHANHVGLLYNVITVLQSLAKLARPAATLQAWLFAPQACGAAVGVASNATEHKGWHAHSALGKLMPL